MTSTTIAYQDGSQKLIGELIVPHHVKTPAPAIIVFSAFEGRGEFSVNYAKALAEKGFVAFVADMYGDAKVANTLEDCSQFLAPFLQDRALVRRRALLAFETLSQQPQVDKDRIGAIGFCFGGMCVLEVARSGVDLKAGVSAHGVLAKANLPTEPLKGKLLILHGYQDPMVPPNMLAQFSEEMASVNNNDWIFTFFGDAKHSFTDPKTGTYDPAKEPGMGRVYNKAAAEYTFNAAVEFFQKQLA